MLFLDLETESECDLLFFGLRRYAVDPSTRVICMAYCFDDDPIKFWWRDEPFPQEVIDHIESEGLITAHNAEFERNIFEFVICPDYDFDPPKVEQWYCSMAMALTNGWGAALDHVSKALGIPQKKNVHGTRLIRDYCVPGSKDIFQYPGDMELMKVYCEADVEVMREITKYFKPLDEVEWAEYHYNCRVNDRGLPIDVDFASAALSYTREFADDANGKISELTGGKMTKHTERKSRDAWLFPRLTEFQMKVITVYKKGEKKTSLDQDHRDALLECDDLDYKASLLLQYINEAGSSALKKYAVAAHHQVDGRLHNTFLWNGANTGRFSGKGFQPHNIRRDAYSGNEAEGMIQDVLEHKPLKNPSTKLARLLRSLITHEEGVYYVDWSAIEGRVAPWLANSESGEEKLDIYRDKRDVYVVTAAKMLGYENEADVDDDGRQMGKVCELSLQFGGSHNALIRMGRNYGVDILEETGKGIVKMWRRVNPWAESIWFAYDKAITKAVKMPGEACPVGRVTFQTDDLYLWCALPRGRLLAYPRPKIEVYETPWGEERIGPTYQTSIKPAMGEEPIRKHLRGALLFQNTCQAVAADILRGVLLETWEERLNIVGHVHDEIVGVGPAMDGELLNELMLEVPDWAQGLPLATGGVKWAKRYGK